MPVVVLHTVSSNDILDNKGCMFAYMDHEKQKGNPIVNTMLRNYSNVAPIIVKKSSGTEPKSFYKDDEFHVFQKQFDKTMSVVNNHVIGGGTVIMCRESIDNEDFNMEEIKKHSPQAYKHIDKHLNNFMKRHKL